MISLEADVIVGSTRYHDIERVTGRVEIGYTWYAAYWQRSHVDTVRRHLELGLARSRSSDRTQGAAGPQEET